jgi:hypothetical protein
MTITTEIAPSVVESGILPSDCPVSSSPIAAETNSMVVADMTHHLYNFLEKRNPALADTLPVAELEGRHRVAEPARMFPAAGSVNIHRVAEPLDMLPAVGAQTPVMLSIRLSITPLL